MDVVAMILRIWGVRELCWIKVLAFGQDFYPAQLSDPSQFAESSQQNPIVLVLQIPSKTKGRSILLDENLARMVSRLRSRASGPEILDFGFQGPVEKVGGEALRFNWVLRLVGAV